jgi:pre-mRNA-splicing factor 38B
VIDEIYESVTSVEPWLTGNARGPSTAFCCMYKLFTLNLSRREIGDTLSHPDSPFIRAVSAEANDTFLKNCSKKDYQH